MSPPLPSSAPPRRSSPASLPTRTSTQFTVHSTEWRLWSNVDAYERQGVSLADLTDAQEALGTALLKTALSADGLETTEKIRRTNQAAGEAIGNTNSFNDGLRW